VKLVGETVRLGEMVARTPVTRDRVVDFLRAASIVAVVFGHWMIGIVWWQDGFFFVGGFSNLVSLDASRRRGDADARFVKTRVTRLLRPSLVFFAVWSAVIIAMHLLDVGAPTGPRIWDGTRLLRLFLPPGATLPFGPLWFLAVYLVVVCIAPWMVDLHRRFRWWVPAVMVAGACVADVIGFELGISPVRWANVAFVLLLPRQLGFFYADGTFVRISKGFFWAMVATGSAGSLSSRSRRSGGSSGIFATTGSRGSARTRRACSGPTLSGCRTPTRGRSASCWGRSGRSAPSCCSGLTAYLLTVLTLWPLGLGHQHDSTAGWWLERSLWIGLSALYLAVLIAAVFGRFERPKRPEPVSVA
jgi:Acyltransferase family